MNRMTGVIRVVGREHGVRDGLKRFARSLIKERRRGPVAESARTLFKSENHVPAQPHSQSSSVYSCLPRRIP